MQKGRSLRRFKRLTSVIILFIVGCSGNHRSSNLFGNSRQNLCLADQHPVTAAVLRQPEILNQDIDLIHNAKKTYLADGTNLHEGVEDLYACNREFLTQIFRALDSSSEADVVASKSLISMLLQEAADFLAYTSGQTKKALSAMPIMRLSQDQRALELFRSTDLQLTLDAYLQAVATLGDSFDADRWLQLSYHLNSFPELKAEPFMTAFAAAIAGADSAEKKILLSKAAAIQILRYGYFFSERAREFQKRQIEAEIGLWQKQRGFGTGFEENKRLAQLIDDGRRQLQNLATHQGQGLPYLFEQLKTRVGLLGDDGALIDEGAAYAKDLFESAYRDRNLELREGDVILKTINEGTGELFNKLIDGKTYISHVGVIAVFREQGYPLYTYSEIFMGYHESSPLGLMTDAIVLRPNFPLAKGFTEESLKNLDVTKKILYDILFSEGMYDSKGEISLYCTEFVHYLFKTHFNLDGPPYTSPYDDVDQTIVPHGSQLLSNVKKLGVHREQNYYIPDSLLYSPHLNFSQFNLYDNGYPPDDNDEMRDFKADLREQFNTKFMDNLREKDIKPISIVEKIELTFLVNVARLKGRTAELDAITIPEGDSAFYFIKFVKIYGDMENFIAGIQPTMQLAPGWGAAIQEKFAQDILRKVDSYFE